MTPIKSKPLTTADAARAWGVSRQRASLILRDGGVPLIAGRYLLVAADIERLRPRPHAGRPPKPLIPPPDE